MISFVLGLLLFGLAAGLMLVTFRRDRAIFLDASADGVEEFGRLLPQLAVGFIGSGFIAAALPQEIVIGHLGPDSGPLGLAIAAVAGALTPGGPVVGFALGAAALKAGAGTVQIVTFVTAWLLFGITRLIAWELPILPRNVYLLRIAVSLPLPLIAAASAAALSR